MGQFVVGGGPLSEDEKAVASGFVKKTKTGFKVIQGKEKELLDLRKDPDLAVVSGAEYGKKNHQPNLHRAT